MYPFRIKHLGRETYTLYSPSAANREEWCGKIIEAKTNHAKALFKQNAEPFKLKVIADTAFAYEGVPLGTSSIPIKDTPLDRAVREVEAQYVSYARPGPVCRAKVNCATTFTHVSGKQMIAVGTDFGVFMSTAGDPRGWQKVLVNFFASILIQTDLTSTGDTKPSCHANCRSRGLSTIPPHIRQVSHRLPPRRNLSAQWSCALERLDSGGTAETVR